MKPHVVIHNQVDLDRRMDHLPIDPGLFYEVASGFREDATLAGTDGLETLRDGVVWLRYRVIPWDARSSPNR